MRTVTNQERQCQTCGRDISHKRHDAIYCSSKCKSYSHNLKMREERYRTQPTINILLQNWRILDKLYNEQIRKVTSFQLHQYGYDLTYMTRLKIKSSTKEQLFVLFDLGLLKTGNKTFDIIKLNHSK